MTRHWRVLAYMKRLLPASVKTTLRAPPPGGGEASLGYRVVAASAPGMAAADTFYCKPKTFKNPVFLKGFEAVLRAGRRKAAFRAQQGRNHPLINFDQGSKRKG